MRPAFLALHALPVGGFLAPLVHSVHLHRGAVRCRNPASILLPVHLNHGLHGRATPSMLHRLGAPHADSVDSALSLVHRNQARTHACACSLEHHRPNTLTLVRVLSGELRIGRVHTCNAYGSVCSKTHWFHAHHCEAPPDGWCNAEGYHLLDGTHQRCDCHLSMSMHMQMSASTTPQHPPTERHVPSQAIGRTNEHSVAHVAVAGRVISGSRTSRTAAQGGRSSLQPQALQDPVATLRQCLQTYRPRADRSVS